MQPKQIIQQQNQITPERFKELCLISTCFNDEETKQINDLINCLFNPELNTLNNIATVTQYVTGGLEYDDFKSKSDLSFIIFITLNLKRSYLFWLFLS